MNFSEDEVDYAINKLGMLIFCGLGILSLHLIIEIMAHGIL